MTENITKSISPQVSVIMCVYNCQKYLPEAIESIIDQTFTDFEFIIIDDGSTDESLSILQQYANQDKRIRIINHSNMGISKSLNEGLRLARGEFIARMDGDDIALKQRLEKQIDYLQITRTCVVVGSRVLEIDSEGEPIMISQQQIDHDLIEGELLHGRGRAIIHPTAMFRREAMIQVGGYQEKYNGAEDLDLYLRLSEIGQLANLPDVLLKFRRHVDSVTAIGGEQKYNKMKAEIISAAMHRQGMNLDFVQIPFYHQAQSVGEHHALLSSMSIKSGFIKTARKHAFKAFLNDPLSHKTLKVMCLSACLTIPGIEVIYRYLKTLRKLIYTFILIF